MRRVDRTTVLVLVSVLLVAAPAVAEFKAADLVYVPVVAHNEGVEGSFWMTDLVIQNVETAVEDDEGNVIDDRAIDVCLFFFPTGLADNSYYLDRVYGLGGRETEEWGHLNEALIDIPAGGSVLLPDVVSTWLAELGTLTNLGTVAVFAYAAGTLDDPDGREPRNIVVHSRTYNETTQWVEDPENEGEFVEVEAAYGQTIEGVPWYDLADPQPFEAGDLSFQYLTSVSSNDDLRYNLGVFNASDSQTSVTLALTPYQADGSRFLDENENPLVTIVTMPPLAHLQYNSIMSSLWGQEEVEIASIRVTMVSWSSVSTEPKPRFTSYGSLIDRRSNDPTTVHPVFAIPYDVDCMWTISDGGAQAVGLGAAAGDRVDPWAQPVGGRPIDIPGR